MTEHILKCTAVYYDAIERGNKNFEVRRDDRGFQKGDVLVLLKYDAHPPVGCGGSNYIDVAGHYRRSPDEAARLRFKIVYVLTGGQLGIEPGYVVMALEPTP